MAYNNFDYSVRWGDFVSLRERPEGIAEYAEIKVHYGYNFSDQRNRNAVVVAGDSVSVDIEIVRSSDTWAVDSMMTDELLKHEQGHYDITAIGARDFHKALLLLTGNSSRNLRTQATQLNRRMIGKIALANRRYDRVTNHSVNREVQQTWDRRISSIKLNESSSLDDLP